MVRFSQSDNTSFVFLGGKEEDESPDFAEGATEARGLSLVL
jgi:hypothetical protein